MLGYSTNPHLVLLHDVRKRQDRNAQEYILIIVGQSRSGADYSSFLAILGEWSGVPRMSTKVVSQRSSGESLIRSVLGDE